MTGSAIRTHGGPDARGPARFDFSTNANACGPCPDAVQALAAADATRYPDPQYTELRARLGALHGVPPARVLPLASGSEGIQRFTALAVRRGAAAVAVPRHAYGDYAHAAAAWGLPVTRGGGPAAAALRWSCEPASPLGTSSPVLPAPPAVLHVVDCAYAPLRLSGAAESLPAGAWQIWSPNKALGLTGVRGAYAIAPADASAADLAALAALAPSWPLGAHAVALLTAWTGAPAQTWLAGTLPVLAAWKARQTELCTDLLGWSAVPGSVTNYFCVQLPDERTPFLAPSTLLARLHDAGCALRDATSFELPGHARLAVLPPAAQDALVRAAEAAVHSSPQP